MVAFSDDLVGRKFGNYRLTRVLGQGGFAKVYLGEHTLLPTKAAIKVLHPHLSREQIDTFLVEAHNSAPLRHPNIVRVLDFGEENHIAYLVMDYAPSTLRQHHPRGTALPLSTIVSYVQQVAAALQYAHDEYRLIHRDVKPENMLVGPHGEILLSDFGIAQVYSTSRMSNEQPEDLAGTVTYMAPEQFYGKAHLATDQYALGITTYEWLCGSLPFRGNTYVEVALKHELMAPPPLHEKIALDRPEIEQVVGRALAKKPELRFATIQAFAEALQEASMSRPRSLSSQANTHLLPGVTPDQDHAPAAGIAPATPPRSISHLSSEPSADRHLPPKKFDDSQLSKSLRQKEMDGSRLSKSLVEEETHILPLRATATTIDGSDDLGAQKGTQLQTNRSDALRPRRARLSYRSKVLALALVLSMTVTLLTYASWSSGMTTRSHSAQERVHATISPTSLQFDNIPTNQASAQAPSNPGQSASLPPEGIYEGCHVYDPACISHLQTIASGGFRVVLNYSSIVSGNTQQIRNYADAAETAGVQLIWAMEASTWWDGTNLLNFYPELAATCKCSDNTGLVTSVITLLKTLPATWGYYIGDGVAASDHDKVKAFSQLVHSIDSGHPSLLIESADSGASSGSTILSPFGDTASVIGSNYYPVGEQQVSVADTGDVAAAVQQVAKQSQRQSAIVLQAFSWAQASDTSLCGGGLSLTQCPFPTRSQMQTQLCLTLQYSHPAIILWFSYYYTHDLQGHPTQHWTDLTTAIKGEC